MSGGAATRGQKGVDIPVPFGFTGETVEAWMFFISRDRSTVSNSAYIGSVAII